METNLLLKSYLKKLRLPTMVRDLEKAVAEATKTNLPYERFLLGLVEQEVYNREENALRARIARAKFPLIKTLDAFDFAHIPSLDKQTVLQLAEGDFVREARNCICIGNSGTGKTHIATAVGVACCGAGLKVRFITAAGLVNDMVEARSEARLAKLLKSFMRFDLVILDELGYIPFDAAGSQMLFNFCAERYERRSLLVTTNLDFGSWTGVFGDESLTGALLDRLTHHCHILVMNGESYRFKESRKDKERKGVKTRDAAHKAQKNQGK